MRFTPSLNTLYLRSVHENCSNFCQVRTFSIPFTIHRHYRDYPSRRESRTEEFPAVGLGYYLLYRIHASIRVGFRVSEPIASRETKQFKRIPNVTVHKPVQRTDYSRVGGSETRTYTPLLKSDWFDTFPAETAVGKECGCVMDILYRALITGAMEWTTLIAVGLFVLAWLMMIYQPRKDSWNTSRTIGMFIFWLVYLWSVS